MRKSHLKTLHDPHHSTATGGRKAKITAGAALQDWYRVHHRRGLPWRAAPGTCGDPYRVWLSEVMLQQTTVATVTAYFTRFLERWPTLPDLAAASQADVLHAWAGLGYYARGRNLHACARAVMNDFGGVFPATEGALRSLPGIGPYTAAAVGAMAFGMRTVPVDGNIERVMTRLYAMDAPVRMIKDKIRQAAQDMLDAAPAAHPGDFAQGLMDLGATICTPRAPKCGICPLHGFCLAAKMKTPEAFPVLPPKKDKPTRYGIVYLIQNGAGDYAIIRRPQTGLLAGMMAFPTTNWAKREGDIVSLGGVKKARVVGSVRHSFTHFNLILDVVCAQAGARMDLDATWVSPDKLGAAGLPRVFAKVISFIEK